MGNYLDQNIKDKKIKLLEQYRDADLNDKNDIFKVTGGFGASKDTGQRARGAGGIGPFGVSFML